ncbi:MAG: PaaI family thioesterase [Lachnospiraceae bacterium]|nr:PaaI family thioesterase [Lachnospiraceae bacterium]
MDKLEQAREMFAKDRFATEQTGAVVEEVAPNHAKCSMKITDQHRNAYGSVMGGAIYTLADFAFAVASNFDHEKACVSINGNAVFLSASRGSVLYAEADLLKDGKNNCFYEVNVYDDLDRLIAVVSFTGAHIDAR